MTVKNNWLISFLYCILDLTLNTLFVGNFQAVNNKKMVLPQTLLYVVPLSWTLCCVAHAGGNSRTAEVGSHKKAKHSSLSRSPDIDFIMLAPPVAHQRQSGLKNANHSKMGEETQEKKLHANNSTRPGILLRIMQIKTFWKSNDGSSKSRRVLEMTLKPMFFVCCLCVLVLIYLLYRAVRIRKSLKNDKHVIQPTDSHKVFQNEA